MAPLARWCFGHRRLVVVGWLVALVLAGGAARAVGSSFSTTLSLPATDSSRATALLAANFPARAGDLDQVVVQARSGNLYSPSNEAAIEAMLGRLRALPVVTAVSSFYSTGLVGDHGRIGLVSVGLDALAPKVPHEQVRRLIKVAQSIDSSSLDVQLEGQAVAAASGSNQPASEALGVALALVVLYFAFRRSLASALLPVVCALVAIGVGTSLISVISNVLAVPSFGPVLATLVALGVGVDYALFVVSRHRSGLLAGVGVEDSVVAALDTSGRAVLFAGLTVCIALLGMFALQISFLYGIALSASLVVALTMAASITLLPALLGFLGPRVLRPQRARGAGGGFWYRWSAGMARWSRWAAPLALGLLVVVALPFFHLRQGIGDAGNDPPASTTRQAYDLLAQAFGPGFNGPLVLVGETPTGAERARFASFVRAVGGDQDVARVGPVVTSPNGLVEVAQLFPRTSPDAPATSKLVDQVRAQAARAQSAGGPVVHVGGPTAAGEDFSSVLASKMPQFVAVVVVLASLVLLVVFRSLAVPLVASAMNLLSIGAALGVLTAVFQYGWGQSLIGFAQPGPIEAFLPVMLFAILFGLSMDYEVFLVSRVHEEWVKRPDNESAVVVGLAETGRVITAAALIMILVFASFVLGGSLVIQQFGVGFAAAIFLDAFVVRTVLVPAAMHLLGRYNWWLPKGLDRLLPVVHVEPAAEAS